MYEHYSQSSESSIKPAREIWNTLSQESVDKGSLVSSCMPGALLVCKEDHPPHNSTTPSHHLSLPTFFSLSFLFCVIPLLVSSFTCPPFTCPPFTCPPFSLSITLGEWHSEGRAWLGTCPAKVRPTHVHASASVVSAMVKHTAGARPIPMTWLCPCNGGKE